MTKFSNNCKRCCCALSGPTFVILHLSQVKRCASNRNSQQVTTDCNFVWPTLSQVQSLRSRLTRCHDLSELYSSPKVSKIAFHCQTMLQRITFFRRNTTEPSQSPNRKTTSDQLNCLLCLLCRCHRADDNFLWQLSLNCPVIFFDFATNTCISCFPVS